MYHQAQDSPKIYKMIDLTDMARVPPPKRGVPGRQTKQVPAEKAGCLRLTTGAQGDKKFPGVPATKMTQDSPDGSKI